MIQNDCNKCIAELKIECSVDVEKRLTKLEVFILANIIEFGKSEIDREEKRSLSEVLDHFYDYKNTKDVCEVVLKHLKEKNLISCNSKASLSELPIQDITINESIVKSMVEGVYNINKGEGCYYLVCKGNVLNRRIANREAILCCDIKKCPHFCDKEKNLQKQAREQIVKDYEKDIFIRKIEVGKMTAYRFFEKSKDKNTEMDTTAQK